MTNFFKAPYGRVVVTSVLPDGEFSNSRSPESRVQIKRRMTGGAILYKRSSDRELLNLRYVVSRMKAIELSQFIAAFQAHEWELVLHDESVWRAKLVGEPIKQSATSKRDSGNAATGDEDTQFDFQFSAIKVS